MSAAAAAAAYPHRPSSSASASLRSSNTGSGTGYSVLPVNSTQFHPAYAAVAAASHLSHGDNLQDLVRFSWFSTPKISSVSQLLQSFCFRRHVAVGSQ